MISGNREQLWFDWQIGSVRVSRIASVCRELDTASCLPASTLEIMTFTSDSLSRVEISQSHVTNVSQFFFPLPQTNVTCDRANAWQSLAILSRGEWNSCVARFLESPKIFSVEYIYNRFALLTSLFEAPPFALLVQCTSINE